MKLEKKQGLKAGLSLTLVAFALSGFAILSGINKDRGIREVARFNRSGKPIIVYEETEKFSRTNYASGMSGEKLNGRFIDDQGRTWQIGAYSIFLNGERYKK